MKVDLHIHTQSSDGSDSVETIIDKAKDLKLEMIAITDHDSMGGVKKAMALGKEKDVHVISGVEFSVAHENEMHILGYFVDLSNKALSEKLDELKNDRYLRVNTFIETLSRQNIDISLGDVEACAFGGAMSRAHIADALVKKGYSKNKDEAFKQYLNEEAESFVKKDKITKEACIKLIHNAGGIAVLAHPIYNYDDSFDYVLDELILYGLNGLEAYHPDHNDEQAELFDEMAGKKGLLISSGSDYHGVLKPDIKIGSEIRTSDYLDYCMTLFYKKMTD